MKLPLANERTAAFAIADEVHHPHATTSRKLIELERAFHTKHRRVIIVERLLLVGHKPIEIEIGADLRAVRAVEVLGVNLENIDHELRHILHEDIQTDG